MAPDPARLLALSTAYIERQAWYEMASIGEESDPIALVDCTVLRDDRPGLARMILARAGRAYQLLLGWRLSTDVANALAGHDGALLGAAEDHGARVVVYDALADDELALEILTLATGGAEHATRVRRVTSFVSHASLVYDERLFMKCYRVLVQGERTEVQAVLGLDRVGYNAMLAPLGHWREHGYDLALVREFLPSALEGRLLALTSLRDLLAHASDASEAPGSRVLLAISKAVSEEDLDRATAAAGGDLASEMRRLGATTAGLHRALAESFGAYELDQEAIVGEFANEAVRVPIAIEGEVVTGDEVARRIGALSADALGPAIRVHGDYHLRRVMRADFGWLVAGFGDDPLYATASPDGALPVRVGSPVEDLADMWFAIDRVAHEALGQREQEHSSLVGALATAWARRNQRAFLRGYLESEVSASLLPAAPGVFALLLAGFTAMRVRRYEATLAPG